ncbi:hypothetical protein [Bradyrhizobium zhanjiangense]|uniref:hypothetical protein n=1 Tax=Bradyrhizobium zhanjiangense TaxID=1325107 RepID=UPI001009DBAB|nr:hypothetical protein [Bradyrhizobium zhanjiangense]
MEFLKSTLAMIIIVIGSIASATASLFPHSTPLGITASFVEGPSASSNSTTSVVDRTSGTENAPSSPLAKRGAVSQEGGYSISIPIDFIQGVDSRSPLAIYKNSIKDMWHSADGAQTIGVDWEADSAVAKIRKLEQTQLIFAERAKQNSQMARPMRL